MNTPSRKESPTNSSCCSRCEGKHGGLTPLSFSCPCHSPSDTVAQEDNIECTCKESGGANCPMHEGFIGEAATVGEGKKGESWRRGYQQGKAESINSTREWVKQWKKDNAAENWRAVNDLLYFLSEETGEKADTGTS